MRKLIVVIILALLMLLVLIPSEVRAAMFQVQAPKIPQQAASAYPAVDSVTPPTVSFGTATLTLTATRTPYFTPTRTVYQTTQFATATSSYANTAAAIRTINAMTMEAATRNSPLYTLGTPSPSPALTETPTLTSTSMPSWTISPTITTYPTVITTPRVLQRGEVKATLNLRSLLIGLGALGLTCFLVVGIWFVFKKG
jgi:hypothetical protein